MKMIALYLRNLSAVSLDSAWTSGKSWQNIFHFAISSAILIPKNGVCFEVSLALSAVLVVSRCCQRSKPVCVVRLLWLPWCIRQNSFKVIITTSSVYFFGVQQAHVAPSRILALAEYRVQCIRRLDTGCFVDAKGAHSEVLYASRGACSPQHLLLSFFTCPIQNIHPCHGI